MKATEARGVTAFKPERKRKDPVPDAPENLHLTRDQFIAKRKAEKAAAQEMAEAAAGIKAKYGLAKPEAPAELAAPKAKVEKDTDGLQAKLADARKKLVDAEAKLRAKPDSQHFNKIVRELNAEVERIENILE